MGQSISRRLSSAPGPICWSCSGDISRTDSSNRLRFCKRCGALAFGQADDELRVAIKTIRFRPFTESLPESEQGNVDLILDKYIRPFLLNHPDLIVRKGEIIQMLSVDFKVMMCFPPSGAVNRDTDIELEAAPISALQELESVSVAACAGTLDPHNQVSLLDTILMPYFSAEEKLLCRDETFSVANVQFKVVSCNPESGRVTTSTRLFCESDTLDDLHRIHVLPIYESLPNREKNITEDELFRKYLGKYFRGRFRMVSLNQNFEIDGVDFRVVAAEPNSGIVTNMTTIYAHGNPINIEEVRQQQLQDDAELARRLQYEESMRSGWRHGAPAVFNIRSVRNQNGNVLIQRRLDDLLAQLPSDNQLRPIIVSLQSRNLQHGGSMEFGMPLPLEIFHGLQFGDDVRNSGADPTRISQLPTRKYSAPPKADNVDAEHTTCRVCLADYENDDLLRTLPCFHVFHVDCVDRWLSSNSTCPICKNPI